MTWLNDHHAACPLNLDEHIWDIDAQKYTCPEWLIERSAA